MVEDQGELYEVLQDEVHHGVKYRRGEIRPVPKVWARFLVERGVIRRAGRHANLVPGYLTNLEPGAQILVKNPPAQE